MKTLLFLIGACVTIFVISGRAVGSEGVRELDELKAKLDTLVTVERQPVRDLEQSYQNRLGEILEVVQKQGNLQGVTDVQEEQKRMETGKGGEASSPAKTSSVQELAAARGIFEREFQRLSAVAQKRTEPLYSAYRNKLDEMIVQFTQSGDLESARSAQQMIDSIPEAENETLFESKGNSNLKIRVQVGGTSFLHVQKNQIWFDHTKGTYGVPGSFGGEFPTYINDKTEWMPTWDGRVSDRFEVDIDFPDSGEDVDIHVRNIDGRGYAKVEEQPSVDNQYTARIRLMDESEDGKEWTGTDWIEFRLSW